jgi:hypothetical protein
MLTDVVTFNPDVDETTYHGDPALSASGAKRLVTDCPAIFKHEQENGRPNKPAYDFGHVAHGLILGVGEQVHVIEAEDWRSKAARDLRDAAYATGGVPILAAEYEQAQALAAAVKAHPIAGALFASGKPEVSAFWHDEQWGVDRRARFDWLTDIGGRPCIVDLKTSTTADPRAFGRKAYDFGYDIQDAFYRDALTASGIDDPAFLFVVVDKAPPHVVTVVELDTEARRIGRARTDRALEIFRDCTAAGVWPGYTDEIELISLPRYAAYDLETP